MEYVIRPKRVPATNKIRYYMQVAPVKPVELGDIAARIERTSTVSSADIKAVLDALQYEVREQIKAGHSVRLGDLGSFRPTIACKGMDKAEDLTVRNIKRVRVQFTPSATLEKELSPAFVSFTKYKHVSDVDCEGAPDLEA